MPNLNLYLDNELNDKITKEMEKQSITSKSDMILKILNKEFETKINGN